MVEMISRQAAIDALHMNLMYRMGTDSNKKRLDEWINNLPSAQPERKKGKWIEKEYSPFYCSVCGTYQYSASWEIKNKEYNFCPRCGARMDGGVRDET